MKRPAFQFYPADWRKDAALQSCSIAAQGLWINALCIAHECDPYGHLTVNGKPMTGAQIARLVGISAKECDKLLGELEDAGVLARSTDGAIFSRRMVRDEDLRNRRANGGSEGAEHGIKGAEHGKKGGRPPKGRGVIYPPIEPPPSSSSSSSSSELPPTPKGAKVRALKNEELEGFPDFYEAYPRKIARVAAAKAWKSINPDEPLRLRIMAALRVQKFDVREEGRFVPYPATWLNAGRWDDQPLQLVSGDEEMYRGAR